MQPKPFLNRFKNLFLRAKWTIEGNPHLPIIITGLTGILLIAFGGLYLQFSNHHTAKNTAQPPVSGVTEITPQSDSGNEELGTAQNPPVSSDGAPPLSNNPVTPHQVPRTTTPPPPSPPAFTSPIGFVGCSNIRDTVQGYQALGGTKFWQPNNRTYGGGTVKKWSNLSSEYWTEFSTFIAAYPNTRTIWWGLCSYDSSRESDADNTIAAEKVLSEIRKRLPHADIYVSGINGFVAPHTCTLTGDDGPERMQALAKYIVTNYGLKHGPQLGNLISMYQTPSAGANSGNNQTASDGCHPDQEGEKFLGTSLGNFFGY